MVSTKLIYSSSKFVLMFIVIKKMIDKLEETVHDKPPGMNNPETYVLTHK